MNAALKTEAKVKILAIGVDSTMKQIMLPVIQSGCEILELALDLESLLEPVIQDPQLVLCGTCPDEGVMIEMAQLLRMHYQDAPIFYLTCVKAGFDKKIFQKNGFSDAFLLPLDSEVLRQKVRERVAESSNGVIRAYRSVKLIDLEAGATLDFDTAIFMPANRKYIRYSAAGTALEEGQVQRLQKHKMQSLYVSAEEMPRFYKYTAEKLRKLGASETMSATEKREKSESAIRSLMADIFNDSVKDATHDQGQAILSDCRNIINEFVIGSESGEWYKRLTGTLGELAGTYSHSANVSTYAALFSIGLGIGDPVEMATAGLLHDIGIASVPATITLKAEGERTEEEKAEYERHPQLAITTLKQKKFQLSGVVEKAILQHHEHFDGSGYPKGLSGNKIIPEAQILAVADRFDELTSAADGQPRMSPRGAILHLKRLADGESGKQVFDPEMLNRILKLFPEE